MTSHSRIFGHSTARVAQSMGCIIIMMLLARSNCHPSPSMELSDFDYILREGFIILPSHSIWYTRLLQLFVGCILLNKLKLRFLMDLIDINASIGTGNGRSRMRAGHDCTLSKRRSLLLLAGTIGCIIINNPIAILVEFMDIWIESRGNAPQNEFILPSHCMWYTRLCFLCGCIILCNPISPLLQLIDFWLSGINNWSRCQLSIQLTRCKRNTLPLASFIRSMIGGISFSNTKEVFLDGLSTLLSSLDSFIIIDTGNGTHVKVDPSCKFLGELSFRGNTQVVHVKLCEGLESLGSKVFRDCSSLKRINIPSTVKVVGEYAFRGCKQLRVVELRKGLERICDGSFVDCSSLERIRIPNTVRVIGDWTFCSCRRLKSVDLPEGLQHIGKWTFYDCTSLQRIKVPSTVEVIDEMAFINCVNLKKVELCKGLVHIANHAFSSCTSLKHIHIPSTVKTIGEFAFVNCTKVEHVVLSEGLEEIGVEAFLDCKSLHRINIPSTIKVIRERTFRGCTSLMHLELEEGLEHIMDCAFESCTTLECIKVPKSVKHIHPQTFIHCQGLIEVKFCEEIENLVREASLQSWWNHGVSDLALTTYMILIEHRIPERLCLLKATKWRRNVHSMLECIPTIESQCLKQYFHSIDSKLSCFENAKDVASVLELAVWKSKMMADQHDSNSNSEDIIPSRDTKLSCRIKCGATVIIPNVLSFIMKV